MAEFPIACNLQGDYGFKVIVVDEDDTIADVIQKTRDQLVGVLVAPFPPNTVLRARIHGAEEPLDDGTTLKGANILQMAALDIYAEG